MRLEEFGGAAVGRLGRRLVVMLAADPGESMIHAGVAVEHDERVLAETVLDLRLRLRRAELVLLGDVQHQRLADPRGLAERLLDADAVIADIAIGIAARRHEIGELAAETVADRADLAGA